MNKLVLSTVLAVSGSLAMVGCTQASAVSESQTTAATKMQHGMHGQHHKGGPMGKRGGGYGYQQLNLTAEQQAQMQALREAQKQKHQANRQQHQAQMQQLHAQTQALINSPTLNTTSLNNLAEQQAAFSKQRFIERVQTQHAMAQILTDEQKAQLQKMREERQAKFKSKMAQRADNANASAK
ncbi:Spy/CpxP family protein refolding chaperone [Psychrobacter phenylpyruvicus]|uniref:Periplasmic repressor CpxP n=1 Tax=Psychrobacter phenylpyruvicus TaxID=29432 RepID=A0A379LMD5_9GAMM|nr:Spy/CpxP family protein refolding chaperone [Psychrobacter phenylpyruvicus]SUD91713.1 periplasmic repressor CpxP [Psychrobacter phenylpyruvicus]